MQILFMHDVMGAGSYQYSEFGGSFKYQHKTARAGPGFSGVAV